MWPASEVLPQTNDRRVATALLPEPEFPGKTYLHTVGLHVGISNQICYEQDTNDADSALLSRIP